MLIGTPGVAGGGGMPATGRPGVETVWLIARGAVNPAAGIAGEFRAPSSFLTTAVAGAIEGVGDCADPDVLLARSSWSRLGAGATAPDAPKGFLRVPLAPLVCGAGAASAAAGGLPLLPNFKVIFGAGSGILSLIFGAGGSVTDCLASLNNLLKWVWFGSV